MKKIIIGLSVVCAMIIVISSVVLVLGSKGSNKDTIGLSRTYLEVCASFFGSPSGTYRAVDKDGHDITEQFYDQYKTAYEKQEYQTISDAISDELLYIQWKTWHQDEKKENDIIIRTYKDDFYALARTPKLSDGTELFEIAYIVTGTCQFEGSTGEIVSYENPGLNVGCFLGERNIDCLVCDATTFALRKDGNAVDFQAVFSLNLSPMYDGPETGDEIVGPFMGTVSGKGEKI